MLVPKFLLRLTFIAALTPAFALAGPLADAVAKLLKNEPPPG